MTPTTSTLPSGAAAHALERARIAELRRAFKDMRRATARRIDADLAFMEAMDRMSDSVLAALEPSSATNGQDGGPAA